MITQWILLGVGFILIAGTALYVSAEFSLVTVDRATVAKQAAEGDSGAKSLMVGLRTLSTQLSGAQVGITVTTLALGFVMQPAIASLVAVPLEAIGLSALTAETVGLILGLSIATVLSMVFGELVPKNIAIAEPLETAKTVIMPMRVSTMIFKPLIVVLNGAANLVLKWIGVEPQEELRSARSAVELDSLVRRSAAQGTLEKPTAGLLARSISFSGKTADDVLTPRVRVRFVKATDSAEDVIVAAAETGHSRFPVSGEDYDDVIGLVHLKRAVAVPPGERATVLVEQLVVPVPIVPGSMQLDDMLDQLRERGLQMAVVADEYGGTAGILTLEDVVEELVGDIKDEHDPVEGRAECRLDDTWLLPGSLRPDEIAEFTGVHLPESGDYETVAGLLISRLGRMPENFDSVEVVATMDAGSFLGVPEGQVGHPDDQPIHPHLEDDLPRSVVIRLTVHQRARRRIESVVMSAVGPHGDQDTDGDNNDNNDRGGDDRR